MRTTVFKALIFDMGEVLVKTFNREPRTRLAAQFNLTFEDLEKIVYFSDSAIKAMNGAISEEKHFHYVLQELGASTMSIKEFQDSFWGGDDVDKDIIDFISSLRNRYKLGMLSNAMDSTRRKLTEKYNLLSYFDVGIISCEVKMSKPSFGIYQLILEKLKVQPTESIFIDDNLENIASARKLGMSTVHSLSTMQTIQAINQLLEQ